MSKQIGLRVGDYIKLNVDKQIVTLTPQSFIDKRLAQSIADFKAGRSYGPFETEDEAIGFLHSKTRSKRKTKS